MHTYTKIIIIIGCGILALAASMLYMKNRELDSHLKSTTSISQNLKSEIDKLSGEIESTNDKMAAAQVRIDKQTSEIDRYKSGRQELVDRMLLLQKEKVQLEAAMVEKAAEVNLFEETLEPMSHLKEDLKITEDKLTQTKRELDELKDREGSDKDSAASSAEEFEFEALADNEHIEKLSAEIEKKQSRLRKNGFADPIVALDLADLHYNLAVLLGYRKEFAWAIQEYKAAIELNPVDADAHYNMAVIFDNELKNAEFALEHYKAYIRLNPLAPDVRKVKQWITNKEIEVKLAA